MTLFANILTVCCIWFLFFMIGTMVSNTLIMEHKGEKWVEKYREPKKVFSLNYLWYTMKMFYMGVLGTSGFVVGLCAIPLSVMFFPLYWFALKVKKI